ncbi:hypothetical protein FA95DRAFT_868211 [Auriscalpium vulgare]|uniref:Uncharacterized protein n=1 Tax=Auriscalpium vulgare TaxID=40419 RepID=A0ACB8R929_9AGAM|nr:hypothetical protein FA95DRAFT_868211 [Auriscalpium vulgare]
MVDDVPNVGRITVPDGLFRSARAIKGKREDIKRSVAGKLVGPDQSFAPSPSSGALYTIFPSTNHDTSHSSAVMSHSETYAVPPRQTPTFRPEYPVQSTSQISPPQPPPHYGAPVASPPAPPTYAHHRSQSSLSYSHPPPPPVRQLPSLVPLEYLENIPPPRRDPADERVLQQFASPRAAGIERLSSESRSESPSGSLRGSTSGDFDRAGAYRPSFSAEASRSSTPHHYRA